MFYCEEKCKHCVGTAVIDYFLNVRRTGPLSAVFPTILNHHRDSYCCRQVHILLVDTILHSPGKYTLHKGGIFRDHIIFMFNLHRLCTRPGVFCELAAKTPCSYKMKDSRETDVMFSGINVKPRNWYIFMSFSRRNAIKQNTDKCCNQLFVSWTMLTLQK